MVSMALGFEANLETGVNPYCCRRWSSAVVFVSFLIILSVIQSCHEKITLSIKLIATTVTWKKTTLLF